MTTLRAKAPAKVNLHLEVLFQREDGFHEIETIFQEIDLHDTLHFRETKGPIHVRCDHPQVPEDRSNLCHRAAKLLRNRTGVELGVEITIEKNIPVAAGLGGGSSDAAATLLALVRLWDLKIDLDELMELAAVLGADVPFFLVGGTQLGRGIGDQLTRMPNSGNGVFLLISPPEEITSAWAYQQLKMGLTRNTPKVNLRPTKAILSRFPERLWQGFNRLGDVVFPAYPHVHRLYLDLQETEPELAMLSGSGPTVYAVYNDVEEAERARDSLMPIKGFSWIGRSSREGIRLLKD